MRRWLVFALVGALVAFSCTILFADREAQAQTAQPSHGPAKAPHVKTAEPAGQTLREAAGPAGSKPKSSEPAPMDTRPVGGTRGGDAAEPVLDKPVPEKAAPAVERARGTTEEVTRPVGEVAEPVAKPIPKEATSVTEPVLEAAAEAAEPVPGKTPPVVERVLEEAAPMTEPIQDTAPTVGPVLEAATTATEPVLNETALAVERALGPALEAGEPVTEPVPEPTAPAAVAPAVKSVLEEVAVLYGNGELTLPGTVVDAPVSLPAISPPTPEAGGASSPATSSSNPRFAPAALVGDVEGGAPSRASARGTPAPAATDGLAGGHPPQFDPPLLGGGGAAPAVAEGAPDRTSPRPAPSGFPPGVVVLSPTGSSSGVAGSGSEAGGASSPATSSSNPRFAPAALVGDVEGGAPSRASARGTPAPAATDGLAGGHPPQFDPPLLGGPRATLGGGGAAPAVAEGAPDRTSPRPAPSGFPPGVVVLSPAGSSSGVAGSGSGLDLLGILALLLVLSRVGGLSWHTREVFELSSSPRPVIEHPG